MKLKNLIITCICLLACNTLSAEILSFKAGDAASYTITQTVSGQAELMGYKLDSHSEATIELDVKILSVNEAQSYPFDVEVILRKLQVYETEQENGVSHTIVYDSNIFEESDFADHIKTLIDYPLNFRVEGEFKVQETTGYLAKFTNDDINLELGFFGSTPWSFEVILTQLFHLSGKDLQQSNTYPTSCYQLLNWEDEALKEIEVNIDQTCDYVVQNIDSEKAEAFWVGKAHVNDHDDMMNGLVFLRGNVTWDINNPMIQKRNLEVVMNQSLTWLVPLAKANMVVHQTWEATAK